MQTKGFVKKDTLKDKNALEQVRRIFESLKGQMPLVAPIIQKAVKPLPKVNFDTFIPSILQDTVSGARQLMNQGYIPNAEGIGVEPTSSYQYFPAAGKYLDYFFRPSPYAGGTGIPPGAQQFTMGSYGPQDEFSRDNWTTNKKVAGGMLPQENAEIYQNPNPSLRKVPENMQVPANEMYAPYGYRMNTPMKPAMFGDLEMGFRKFLAKNGITF